MRILQEQILQDEAVKAILGKQQPDGWLGWAFHGYDSMEADMRLLCEKGVERDNPILEKALGALEEATDRLERGLGKVGRILDERGFGGSHMIRSVLFALAGAEDHPLVQEQIPRALKGFEAVFSIESRDKLVDEYRGKHVYRQAIQGWPGIYHLRLLALTHGWRTEPNQSLVHESIQRLIQFSPLPLLVRHRSQLIAPASFCASDLNSEMSRLDDAQWMLWFHRFELFARLGVVAGIPELRQQANYLRDLLEMGGGFFTRKLNHPYFRKWGAYTGLALESDWKSNQRRENDLTFRSLLILHYSCVANFHVSSV
jgi:hypothetical protein